MPAKYISLACGLVFVDSVAWVNFDFFVALEVQKAITQITPKKYTYGALQ